MQESSNPEYTPGRTSRWVIGTYSGARMKSVLAHAEAGVGYLVLGQDMGSVTVAFIYAGPWPAPSHLQVIDDPHRVEEYSTMWRMRQGLHKKQDRRQTDTIVNTLGGRFKL
jgi:hypothetical protein